MNAGWAVPACLVLMLVGFSGTVASFPDTWNNARTHGYAVLAFCLWMVAADRRLFSRGNSVDWPVELVAVVASMLWLAATIVGVRVVHQAMLPALFVLWATSVFGERGLRLAIPVALIFSLAVPFWEILVPSLQWMTVKANSTLIALFGLGATIDGQRIHFPFGTIEVAESCAGLSYFMSALTISVIYSRLFLRTGTASLIAITLALTLAVISNWIRVFGLVWIGYRTHMQSPLMSEHATYGWVIFAVVISFFFLLTGKIERWESGTDNRFDVWANALRSRGVVASQPVPLRNLVVATAAVLTGPILYYGVSAIPANTDVSPDTLGLVPAAWSADAIHPVSGDTTATTRAWTPNFSGYTELRQLRLTRGEYAVQLDHVIFTEQRQGAELVGGGNSIAQNILSERLAGPLDENLRMAREATIRTASGARLVWYWYRVAGIETPSPTKAKLLELLAFVTRRRSSELVAISAPCGATNCGEALGALYLLTTGKELTNSGATSAVR